MHPLHDRAEHGQGSLSPLMPFHSDVDGRYALSALARRTDGGHYTASLSIRSGSGSGSHDRVFRFTPLFATAQDAQGYALAQGREYLALPALPA